ncbi:HNH endonuclease [Kytococcus sedentarius]|uniref:HNH endonuclease n=1 Tax=Kytococcus sedentarius TaxID=1276 RepID=UPI001950BD50|nr:HNH endonuclease signature motif containing protein [Kytococcus sedentarius]QRO88402.1 DUF222 domain-containing protein [Kytococcus sedentarius]
MDDQAEGRPAPQGCGGQHDAPGETAAGHEGLRAAVVRRRQHLGKTAQELVDTLRELEELRNTVAAVQLEAVARLQRVQTAEDLAAGVPEEMAGECTASMVGLARRESPHRGAEALSLAESLAEDLPCTLERMLAGRATEYQARLVQRHTSHLTAVQRQVVDQVIAPRLEDLSPRRVTSAVQAEAYRLDPEGSTRRAALAHRDRKVRLQPKPDTMTLLTAYLPAAQGVAVWAGLDREARSRRAVGDERSIDQLRADILVERLTGQATAQAVPLEVQLVVPAGTVFGGAATREVLEGGAAAVGAVDGPCAGGGTTRRVPEAVARDGEPAFLTGYGPLPAPLARSMIRESAEVRLRRLLLDPLHGTLVGRESRARTFSRGDRELLVARDRFCRTPWCDAPIREADHVVGWAEGGSTSIANGQGLCSRCNQVKNHPRWDTRPVMARPDGAGATAGWLQKVRQVAGDRATDQAVDRADADQADRPDRSGLAVQQAEVVTTTPTGHRYRSPVPSLTS